MNGNAYIHYKHDYFLRKNFLRANLGVAKKSVMLGHRKKNENKSYGSNFTGLSQPIVLNWIFAIYLSLFFNKIYLSAEMKI